MIPWRLVLFIFFPISTVTSLNVLVYSPTMGYSHVQFMGNIANVLAEDGHNVTMLLVEYDPDVTSNGTTKSNRVIRYVAPRADPEAWRELDWRGSKVFTLNSFTNSDFVTFLKYQLNVCQSMLEDKELVQLLKSSHFDIAVAEVMQMCPIGLFHLAGIPKLTLASALGFTSTHYLFLDMPIWLSQTPTFGATFGSVMSLSNRIENFLIDVFTKGLMYYVGNIEQSYFEKHFPGFPSLFDLGRATVDYVLLNSNEFTESTRTILPSIRHVGGSTIYNPSTLTRDFEKIYTKAKNGVVIFSMGSIVKQSTAPSWFRNVFLQAFKKFPNHEFIWKDDCESYSDENIHFRRWIPQVSLLADNRTKAFVSHAGPNSIIEATYFGVPMVLIPMFWDQNWHASAAEEKGYAIKLSKFTLTKEVLVNALEIILCQSGNSSCSSYGEKAQLASRILKDSPEAMREDIRRVVRISGENREQLSQLRLSSGLPLLRLYNFDVYAVLLIVFIVCVAMSIRLLCWLYFTLRNKVEKSKID